MSFFLSSIMKYFIVTNIIKDLVIITMFFFPDRKGDFILGTTSLATRSDCLRNLLCSFTKPVYRNVYLSFPRTRQQRITIVYMLQRKATMKKQSKPPGGPLGMPKLIVLGSWVTNPTLHCMAAPSPIGRQISTVRSQMSCLLSWVNLIMLNSLENPETGLVSLPYATHLGKQQPKFSWRWTWDWQALRTQLHAFCDQTAWAQITLTLYLWSWTHYLIFLKLSFLICRLGIMIIPP